MIHLDQGSEEEVEIRAGTIWQWKLMRREMKRLAKDVYANGDRLAFVEPGAGTTGFLGETLSVGR